jgi:hypothetical protein
MNFNWKKYRKLIPAVVGVATLLALRHWGITIHGLDVAVLEWLVSAATVFGVYQAKNEQ